MAYEITANRRRPASFGLLAGQDFVVSTLRNSLASGRIAHAYLFAGPRGVGKTSAARILARALNCEKGPTAEPCGVCSNCAEIARGNSLDVLEIDGASNTSVNDVRQIKDEVLFAPTNSRYKVYIIDEVHMLSNSAFNALLKTIEEPPPYIVFIFATTELHKVPATIRSRCQQFNFRLIPLETVREMLVQTCAELGVQAENDALLWIAKEATGSLRDAYTLFDQVASFSDKEITLEKIRTKLGLAGFDTVDALIGLFAAGKTGEALAGANDIIASGVPVEQLVIDLSEYYRNLLFIKSGVTREGILGVSVDRFSKPNLEAFSAVQLEKALELLLDLYRGLRYTLNSRFELDLTLARLSGLKDYLSPQELHVRIQALRRELAAAGQARGAQTSAAALPEKSAGEEPGPPADGPAAGLDEKALSPEVRKAILAGLSKKKKVALAANLEKSQVWELSGDALVIPFDSKFSAEHVGQEQALVAETAAAVLGRPVKILVRFVPQTEKGESATDEDAKVEIARRVFRGEIVQ